MTRKLFVITGLLSLLAAQAASAQPRWGRERMPDRGVCFYEDKDFKGRYFCLRAGDRLTEVPNGIGDEISSASRLDARPLPSKSGDPLEERRWKLPDGNRLSVAADPGTQKIVYAETKWGGGAHGKPADFPGFAYGETTLADIRAHAQNNGFAFKEHLIEVRRMASPCSMLTRSRVRRALS